MKIKHKNKIITFDEDKHQYISNNQKYISVTENVSRFFESFDLQKQSFIYAINHNKNQNNIIKQWKEEGKNSANFGTKIHKYIECVILRKKLIIPETDKEEIYFKHINKWLKKFLLYFNVIGIEKIVFTPHYKMAGTIDAIFQNKKTGRFLIIDWKTCKRIEFINKWQKCINGLEKFDASSGNKFIFQLNSYLYILKNEKYYKFLQKPKLMIIHITENGIENIPILILEKKNLDIIFKMS